MTTLRKQLSDRLRPLIPKAYTLRPNATQLEQLSGRVLLVKQLRLEPSPAAPVGSLTVEFVLTLVTPLTSPQAAEDQLDDDVTEIVTALDQLDDVTWTSAEKVTAGPSDNYLAYDIRLTCTTAYQPYKEEA